jgi:molybdate transport system substrate-binding protein
MIKINRANIIVYLMAIVLLAGVAACQMQVLTLPFSPSATAPETITVAAAADLLFAFQEIADLYEQETGRHVRLVFGSTGQLTQQIEHGAPYDLTAAANIAYVERLSDQGLVLEDSISLYARGRIVLAVNRQSGVKAVGLEDLLDPAIRNIAIANPEHAPYGVAAQEALQSAGIWERVQDKLVRGENVRQALQYVQSGDAQVGIVALSVAYVPEITWTLIDEELHAPLDQALGVLASSKNPDAARHFAGYINGQSGRPVMRRYGFLLPGEPVVETPKQDAPSE